MISAWAMARGAPDTGPVFRHDLAAHSPALRQQPELLADVSNLATSYYPIEIWITRTNIKLFFYYHAGVYTSRHVRTSDDLYP